MHRRYINGKERWNKTLSSALDKIVNRKGGNISYLTTKRNPGSFRGE